MKAQEPKLNKLIMGKPKKKTPAQKERDRVWMIDERNKADRPLFKKKK